MIVVAAADLNLTDVLVNGSNIDIGTTVVVAVMVTPAPGYEVKILIDQFNWLANDVLHRLLSLLSHEHTG